jgi:hypothetical protein
LVKPIKIGCSRSANEFGIHQLLIPQAEAQMGTADASVLWKTDPAVREKMAGFNLLDGCFYQLAKFPTLFCIDGCVQILNLGRAFADEHHQRNVRDSGHPGVADELGIERQETIGLFWVARCCAIYLAHLKRTIEQRGLRSDEDLEFIRLIYGNQMTALAETIVALYKTLEPDADLDKTDGNVEARKIDNGQARILEVIQREIYAQEIRRELEKVRESFEPTSGSVVLPAPDVDDRIERYRTANMRKMERLLAVLETVRRLKKEA